VYVFENNIPPHRPVLMLFVFIYPAMTAFTDQYSLPNNFVDIGQL
jgi:hypothetical protein